MKDYDVVIIGGGITGAAIARELSRYRLRTALLEKEEELAFGVSKSNSGIIHPGTQNPPGSLKACLCVEGNRLTRRLARELGVDFKQVGELIVALREEEVPQLLQIKEDAEQLGVPKLQMVDPKWLCKHEPNLTRDAVAALYAPTAGIISPYRWVYDFAENAAVNGVEFYLASPVQGIEVRRSGAEVHGARFEITTPRSAFRTRYLINAAGLYADDIARMVGVEDVRITPRKGEEYLLDKKRELMTNHLIFPLPTKTSKGVLIIKTSDGNPMIGPTAHDVHEKDDLATTEEGFAEVLSSVQRYVPAIDRHDVIAYFAGLRPVAGDDFIIRHETWAPGCITVAGIQSPGLTAAPAIALLVRELLRKQGLVLTKRKGFQRFRQKSVHLFSIRPAKTKKLIDQDAGYGDIVCRCEMVSAKEIEQAIDRGATTLDGIKFRTRAQAGRCHGGFCTTRLMKILSEKLKRPLTEITKRGKGSEMIKAERGR